MQHSDRETARQLPEEFVRSSVVGARERIDELVSRHWKSYARRELDDLVRALLPVLEPLLESGAAPSYQEQDFCEAIVASWAARH
jgi:hypothetical protein